jgi:hypothetical protein
LDESTNQPANTTGLIVPPAESASQEGLNQPNEPVDPANAGEGAGEIGSGDDSSPTNQADDSSALPSEPHPAIALAQKHRVAAGKPRDGHPRYRTPPPYDIFAARAAKQGRKP